MGTFQYKNTFVSLQLTHKDKRVKKLSYLITMMSQWARWHLKSPALWLFTPPFIRTQIKENIKSPRHWPLCREYIGDRSQGASNAENVSIWWCHHVYDGNPLTLKDVLGTETNPILFDFLVSTSRHMGNFREFALLTLIQVYVSHIYENLDIWVRKLMPNSANTCSRACYFIHM